jgi:sulfonate transport system substrate-binding protein
MATKLRVGGVPEHFNAPWHIAKSKGLFSGIGLDVDWTDYPGGTGAMAKALNEDELDVAVILTEGCVKDIATGGKHKIIAVYVQSPLCWGIHTGAGQADVQEVKDLDGKVFAVSRMTSGSHLMAVVLAEKMGWDTKALKYEIVNNLDGAKEALTKATSHGFLWEKFTTKPHVDSGVLRRVGEIPTPWPCFVVAVRNEVIESSGGKLKEMMDVLGGVCREFKADASSSAYIAKEYGLKVSIRRPYCVSNRSAHIAHHLSGIIASCIIHLPEDPESINNLSPDVSPPPTPRCLPFILRHWPPMSHTAARRLCRVVLYRGMVV